MDDELISVRKGEEFDYAAVKEYLQKHLDIPNGELKVKQFPAGSSNLTYLLQIEDWEAVLRRPPLGPLPPKAHDMKRESGLLSKLYPEFQVVPKPYLFCEDEEVIGSPFYVMERKTGVVLNDTFPNDGEVTKETKQHISRMFIDTLVQLHEVDYEKAGLTSFGHPEGFLERQVHGWIKRYKKAETDTIDSFDPLAKWLINHIPTSRSVSVIHNDFKLNNILLSKDYQSVNAVFDWEMSTIADPLFDLGVTLGYWVQQDDPAFMRGVLPTLTYQEGFYTRRELIERYAKKTGKDMSNIHFYIVFGYFKLAGILQQIYYRYVKGQTSDARFAKFKTSVRNLLDYAYYISDKQSY